MRSQLQKLARFWLNKINPKIVTLITTLGTTGFLVCLAIIYILAELSDEVLEKESFAFDKTILLWIHQYANPTLDQVMLIITKLGNPKTMAFIALLTFSILLWRSYYDKAKVFAFNCLGATVLNYGLKLAFNKSRPQLWTSLISETSYSYPSGHAMGSMVLYGFLAYLLSVRYPQYNKLFYGMATVLIAAIGFSRLYLGVHWPTDIVGGYGVGFLWITLCIVISVFNEISGRADNSVIKEAAFTNHKEFRDKE